MLMKHKVYSFYLNYIVAVSSFDNHLRVWDIDDKKIVSEI